MSHQAQKITNNVIINQLCLHQQVREVNFYKEGDLTHFNQKLTNCYLQRVWNELIEKCDYEKRRELVHAFNR